MDWVSIAIGVAQVIIAGVGLALVYVQLRKNGDLAKVEMVMNVNSRLVEFADVVPQISKLTSREDWDKLPEEKRERILDYISVFETVEVMNQMKAISVSDIEFYFAGRFADLLESKGLRDAVFYDTEFMWQMRPTFRLHNKIQRHRKLQRNRLKAVPSTVAALDDFENHDASAYKKVVSDINA